MDYKPVELGTILHLSGNRFHDDSGNTWLVTSLIRMVKELKLEVFELPMQGIDISVDRFEDGDMSILQVARHMERANETELKYPIILSASGCIMDGWHRILKALIQKKTTIKAVRFTEDPIPDYTKAGK